MAACVVRLVTEWAVTLGLLVGYMCSINIFIDVPIPQPKALFKANSSNPVARDSISICVK